MHHQTIKRQQPNTRNSNHQKRTYIRTLTKPLPHTTHSKMSFLFGQGRPQPSSAEKIAAAEAEIEMVSNMFNQ
jgi:hypothetical protein